MPPALPPAILAREAAACAYPRDDGARCGASRAPGSSYCAEHHALCHLRRGSIAERRALREIRRAAAVMGGRLARRGPRPPTEYLDRLEQLLGD